MLSGALLLHFVDVEFVLLNDLSLAAKPTWVVIRLMAGSSRARVDLTNSIVSHLAPLQFPDWHFVAKRTLWYEGALGSVLSVTSIGYMNSK